jgi:hypothetical protein
MKKCTIEPKEEGGNKRIKMKINTLRNEATN